MKISFKSVAVFVALLLGMSIFGAASVQAQRSGSIAGSVTDPDGAAIAQALITLYRASSDATQQAVSDAQGQFEFHELDPGVYRLAVEAPGFQSSSRETAVF